MAIGDDETILRITGDGARVASWNVFLYNGIAVKILLRNGEASFPVCVFIKSYCFASFSAIHQKCNGD